MNNFNTIPEALDDLKKGKMLIVLDDSKRENQGDLIFAAEAVTVKKINFMLNYCRGQICVPITHKKAYQLELPLMVMPLYNTEKTGVNFTVTVDAKKVTSFGISAEDRVQTIKLIEKSDSRPEDLVRPGHVFPLLAREGGIMKRDGHTEATVDLLKLAHMSTTGVLCEILNDSGAVADRAELMEFAQKYDLKIITIPDLKKYVKSLKEKETKVTPSIVKKASSQLPTRFGIFKINIYHSLYDNREHAALILGDPKGEPMLTRIHSKCFTGDTFYSLKCDCHDQLQKSFELISKNKRGLIIYLNQEGRGIGLTQKIRAYALQEKGLDTVEANNALGFPSDPRDYTIAADILRDLGISEINLLTNNPRKINQMKNKGITIVNRVRLEIVPQKYNKGYLTVKKLKLGHDLSNV